MFLRCKVRRKDGKQHRYWSVVENTRVAGGRVAQRHVLYLGEINDTQELVWRRSIAVVEDGAAQPRTLSLFPEDRCEGLLADASIVRVKLSELRLRRPRQWGACWLALLLWRELQLDQFWSKRLGVSRKGTRWDQVLFVLVAYRLLAPGSEWRLHREWFQRSALADLLGEDAGLAEIHKLYRCHDRLLVHKQAVFDYLVGRWRDLFNVSYDVLLYDLTSTYFEADPPFPEGDKRRFGYSRDHRPDRVQIVGPWLTPSHLPDGRGKTPSSLEKRPLGVRTLIYISDLGTIWPASRQRNLGALNEVVSGLAGEFNGTPFSCLFRIKLAPQVQVRTLQGGRRHRRPSQLPCGAYLRSSGSGSSRLRIS